ncbi:MAG: twin-arginine translocation signal domain-containing protein, partial [Chitinophagaceae bacterium]
MNPSKQYLQKLGLSDTDAPMAEQHSQPGNPRRNFLKNVTAAGCFLGSATLFTPIEELVAQTTQRVNRFSRPSDLKITDLRFCV